jgi:hypothetical protein
MRGRTGFDLLYYSAARMMPQASREPLVTVGVRVGVDDEGTAVFIQDAQTPG